MREIASWVVPMRSATCCWVSPASRRLLASSWPKTMLFIKGWYTRLDISSKPRYASLGILAHRSPLDLGGRGVLVPHGTCLRRRNHSRLLRGQFALAEGRPIRKRCDGPVPGFRPNPPTYGRSPALNGRRSWIDAPKPPASLSVGTCSRLRTAVAISWLVSKTNSDLTLFSISWLTESVRFSPRDRVRAL